MTVNTQRPIVIQNACEALYDDKSLISAILWFSDKPVVRIKKIYMYGRYPAVSIGKAKIHIHRLIKMHEEKRTLHRNEHVHHINHNRCDARPENLQIIDAGDHLSKHHSGKVLSAEHKEKISLANKRRKGVIMKRKYNMPYSEIFQMLKKGMSIRAISIHYGCDRSVIKKRITEHPHLLEAESQ